jgi:hypothetical protein
MKTSEQKLIKKLIKAIEIWEKEPDLKPFLQKIDFFKLLLEISTNRNSNTGLNEIASMMKNLTIHHNTSSNFLRDRLADGHLISKQGDRIDKKILRVPPNTLKCLVDGIQVIANE